MTGLIRTGNIFGWISQINVVQKSHSLDEHGLAVLLITQKWLVISMDGFVGLAISLAE